VLEFEAAGASDRANPETNEDAYGMSLRNAEAPVILSFAMAWAAQPPVNRQPVSCQAMMRR